LIQTQAKQIQAGLLKQPLDGQYNLENVQAYTAKLLTVVPGSLNEEVDGRYVLAGADADTIPYKGNTKLKEIVQKDMSDWLDGTITTEDLLAKIEAYTDDE